MSIARTADRNASASYDVDACFACLLLDIFTNGLTPNPPPCDGQLAFYVV